MARQHSGTERRLHCSAVSAFWSSVRHVAGPSCIGKHVSFAWPCPLDLSTRGMKSITPFEWEG